MAHRDSVTARNTTRRSLELPHPGHLSASTFRNRLTGEGKRPQDITKEQKRNPLRRSARLDRLIVIDETQQKTSQHSLPSPVSDGESANVSHQRYSMTED